tara:strand:+ start:396 stop:962 length:567 start_codon:yes stop_codon:yes gene_type:complete
MARNGSGAMSIDNADFQAGANIVANELDANFTTIVAELTNSVAVDGQSTMSGDLAMGTNKITGIGDPTADQDAVTKAFLSAGYYSHLTINDQTGTTYTLVLADDGKYVRLNNGSAITMTIPANSSVAFPIGTQIAIRQVGAGQVTLAAAGGVTVNTAETLLIRGQKSSAAIIKVATDEWDLSGDLQAS